ncbi:unnamed protein product, partial [Iphiclides podalirius]
MRIAREKRTRAHSLAPKGFGEGVMGGRGSERDQIQKHVRTACEMARDCRPTVGRESRVARRRRRRAADLPAGYRHSPSADSDVKSGSA